MHNRLVFRSCFVLVLSLAASAYAEPPVESMPAMPPNLMEPGGGNPPHLLVRPPVSVDAQGRVVDPRYAGHHHSPVTAPGAVSENVWRTPYAYGYFGARPKKHLSQHFGIMRQYNQWTHR